MRYDFSKEFTITENGVEKQMLYGRGILTIEVIGLAKTNTGKFVVPTFRIDEKGNMQNFFFKQGKPLPLYTFKNGGKEEELSQSPMSGKTKEKKLFLWCNEKGVDKFYRLEAWEFLAKKLNMFYEKGDEVTILAQKVVSKGAETGQSEELWVIQDISKVKKDFEKKKVKKEDNNFKPTEDIGLPFN